MTSSRRVLILSADVAGGHDAAARALADDIRRTDPDAVVCLENGLRVASRLLHRVVRDGYRYQIGHASPTYALLFRLFSFGPVACAIRWLLAWLFGRRFYRAIQAFDPDIVVSTYPVVTALLGTGRRKGAVQAVAVAVITDADPSILWLAPGIDLHFLAVPNDVERVTKRHAGLRVVAARPPIRDAFLTPRDRLHARAALSLPSEGIIVLVSGGGWGVGDIGSIVAHLLSSTDAFLVVACGTNDRVRSELSRRYSPSRVRPLPFWDDMPGLFAACDVLVHTGAGMTCFEAVASAVPVVLFNVLPGHGARSAAALKSDGMVQWARSSQELTQAIASCREHRSRSWSRAQALRQLPPIVERMSTSTPAPAVPPVSRPVYLRKSMAVVGVFLCALSMHIWTHPVHPGLTHAAQTRQSIRQVERYEQERGCTTVLRALDADDRPWSGRNC